VSAARQASGTRGAQETGSPVRDGPRAAPANGVVSDD
jgi:hypothetical protein